MLEFVSSLYEQYLLGSHLIFLSLRFLMYEVGRMTLPLSLGSQEE